MKQYKLKPELYYSNGSTTIRIRISWHTIKLNHYHQDQTIRFRHFDAEYMDNYYNIVWNALQKN